MKPSLLLQIVAVHVFVHHASSKDVDYEYELQRVEPIFGDEETLFECNLKVIRKNKEYFINDTGTFTTDFDDNYQVITETLHSPMMNSNFMKTPFRLPPSPFCVFLNTTYKEMIQSELIGNSNIPFVPEEGLCPLPKGTYYFKDAKLTYKMLPQHMSPGMWCFKIAFMSKNKCVGGFRVFFKIISQR